MMMDSRADALVVLVCGLSESTSRWTSNAQCSGAPSGGGISCAAS